ncbi:hypothetical protein ACVWW2_005194 [Bradyrhizobium sp. LM4.3]
MKMLPTALIVPSSSLKVWLTIAPPLEASAPAPLGNPCGAELGAGVGPASVGAAGPALPRSNTLVSMPWLSRKDFTFVICDLMVLLSTEA